MTENKNSQEKDKSGHISLKFKKPKPLTIAIGIVFLLVIVGWFFARGLFVAATVNGSPISRLSVIRELEKQGGAQVLDTLINQKLIETELDKQGVIVDQTEIDKEIQEIEVQVASQGGTLADMLISQGMSEEEFNQQIIIQKKLEKLLTEKTAVSDEEVDAYITDNNVTTPEDIGLEEFKDVIRGQLEQQKFQQEAQQWVSTLMTNANIKYQVEY